MVSFVLTAQQDDGDRYVRTNLNCNTSNYNIMVELYHDYTILNDHDISNGRLQLFYYCENPSGNVSQVWIF